MRVLQRTVRRNRAVIALVPLITLAAALTFVRLATPIYEGEAFIRVDRERSNLAVLAALQELSTGGELQTEVAELKTTRLAAQVVDSLDLHVAVAQPRRVPRSELIASLQATPNALRRRDIELERTAAQTFVLRSGAVRRQVRVGEPVELPGLRFVLAPGAARHDAITLVVTPFAATVRRFRKEIVTGRPDREASVVRIRYESSDPILAAAVPNVVAAIFLGNRDDIRKSQARSTVAFLERQIDTLGAQLRAAEAGLLGFRERERVIDPTTEAETRVRQAAEWQAEREALEAERNSIASVLADVERTGADAAANRRLLFVPALLKNPATSELIRELNEAENRRIELKDRRTTADPEFANLNRRMAELDDQLRTMAVTSVQALDKQIARMDEVLAGFTGELASIPSKEMQLARMRRQTKVTEELYTALQLRLKEAEIAAAVDDPSVRVIDPAIAPDKPIRPNAPLSVALALFLGLALGVGIAIIRDQMDTTIRSRDELQDLSGSIPVLGQVPRMPDALDRRRTRTFFVLSNGNAHAPQAPASALTMVSGPVAEAYRTLRTNIAFSRPDRPAKVLVVTSALPGEGKSTSAFNLALTLARQGLRVALVDADMRRGRLHESFGAPAEPGLANVLVGRAPLADALRLVDFDGQSLMLLPTGPYPPNPAELLASDRVAALYNELRRDFDAVIVDTPPLNVVSDGALASVSADGVLLIARAGVTERDALRDALGQLDAVRAQIIGTVLNGVHDDPRGYYARGASYLEVAARAQR